ncbi:sigma-70 family RNA polymerase sigma factor [Acidisoma silvae]|uniref:Sigma-70 family RNA polymerase sigma factor n=1 Tax=Acidisoma silvae TaxID=2802396 RepID=A0A963YNU0_9PROT|nr:sigma-70 family RNA polymerase sigma factor [Acidisoma silvae]MCB8874286.1 sigma-70 family RNA polymerase sigma factor [Acidisoma silvae]
MAILALDARSRLASLTRTGNSRPRQYAHYVRPVREWHFPLSQTSDIADRGDDALTALLLRCATGDRTAFRALYDAQSSRLHGLAMRITRDPALAADATHDAFVQVWNQAVRFDPARGAAGAWLTSIVRYRALDITRRRVRETPGYEPPELEDETPNALAQLVTSDEGAALRRCLEELEPDRRSLLVQAFTDGLTHNDISEKTGTPLGTIKSWIRRSLASLKRCLEA